MRIIVRLDCFSVALNLQNDKYSWDALDSAKSLHLGLVISLSRILMLRWNENTRLHDKKDFESGLENLPVYLPWFCQHAHIV